MCNRAGMTPVLGESALLVLIAGAAMAWLAGRLVLGSGLGLGVDTCIGIVGAAISSGLLMSIGVDLANNRGAMTGAAMIGAVILLGAFGRLRTFVERRRDAGRPAQVRWPARLR